MAVAAVSRVSTTVVAAAALVAAMTGPLEARPQQTAPAAAAVPSTIGEVYRAGRNVTAPVLKRKVEPTLPSPTSTTAPRGAVWLEAIVLADGTVGSLNVVRALVPGFDDAAIAAARKWQFQPGLRDGKPVNVAMTLLIDFQSVRRESRTFAGQLFGPAPDSDAAFLDGVTLQIDRTREPIVKTKVEPRPTTRATQRKLAGRVGVDVVVGPDGVVSRVRIRESLDVQFGLDDAALAAALESRFDPGMAGPRPVPAVAEMTFEFRVR